ncbi:S-layer family protein [Kineothrix alysoides]|uniref:S-layer family protein n=1 Tax=Kineothrix alysoides TaxID=1469948 RepID=A0A4R1R5X4_9FIRM|nr:S-layer homology domain-containing protein [Kineothrix alysoides]TCL60941.1 S-layer family protein [Kineothrix alysoides]
MKRTWKQISSLFLAVCMVFTMLPMTAFAETDAKDSGQPLGISSEITAFADLDTEVSQQTEETGTAEDELNLPQSLMATATDSEGEEDETAIPVSGWTAEPDYDGDAEGDYLFTPALNLPEGLTLAEGVTPPAITVTVTAPAAPAPRGVAQLTSTGTVTGTMNIGGTTVDDLSTGTPSGKGWAWNASDATLTLDYTYVGQPIAINCQSADTVSLVYTGDVSITSAAASAIYCVGNLNITGSGGTLKLDSTSGDSQYCAIEVYQALTIGGSANVNATCAGSGTSPSAAVIYGMWGVTVSGSANVTATATGTDASGIWVENGDITISTGGTVTANGNGIGGALAMWNGMKLNMTSGNLALTGAPLKGIPFADLLLTGGSVTLDGTSVYKAVLTLSGVSAATPVTAISSPASGYGVSSKNTNADGKLCFLLPAGDQTITLTAGGSSYTGTVTVTTDNAATATLTTGGTAPVNGWTLDDGHLTITSNEGMTGWIAAGYNPKASVTALTIGAAVSSIPVNAFVSCIHLATVTFDGTPAVTSIDGSAFAYCALTAFTIPASVNAINPTAFIGTPIAAFTVADGNTVFSVSPQGALLTDGGATLYAFPRGNTGTYTVETGITAIGDFAFDETDLSVVVIPDTVTSIGGNAFSGSSTLAAVVFESDTPPDIGGDQNFQYCDHLSSIYVPAGAVDTYKGVTGLANCVDMIKAASGPSPSVSDESGLKAALEYALPQTITVAGPITLSASDVTVGADHTLNINGNTLTISNNRGIITNGKALTINGGGTVKVANPAQNGIRGGNGTSNIDGGTLNLVNVTVDLENTGNSGGLSNMDITVGNGATINLKSPTAGGQIRLGDNRTLTISTGAAVNVNAFTDRGIDMLGGTMHVDGGTLSVKVGSGVNQGISSSKGGNFLKYSSGTLSPEEGSGIYLIVTSKLEGMGNKFKDRGTVFTASGQVAVGASNAPASAAGLTEGTYFWNGTQFEKHGIIVTTEPQDATVTQGAISGFLSAEGTASNGNPIDCQWWQRNEVPGGFYYSMIAGATGSSFSIPTNLTAGTYIFRCQLTAAGCHDGYTRDVTVTVNPPGSVTTYTVTVTSGTGSGSYAQSATVTITADTAPSGQRFKDWTITPSVTFTDGTGITSQTAKFTMPAQTVTATATYEPIPAGTTAVTGVNLNRNSLSLYSNTSPNAAALTATVSPADATEPSVTWRSSNTAVATVDTNGMVTAAGNGTATITVTTTDGGYSASCAVTVTTYSSSGRNDGNGSSSGGSSSGSSGGTTTTTTPGKTPNQPVTAATPVTATAGTNGTASASIPEKSVTDAIAKAQADAKAQGKTANGISVVLNVTMPKGATSLTAALTRNSLNSLVSAGVTRLKLSGSPVTVSFDAKTLAEIQKQTTGNISITISPNTSLSASAKAMIGSRPVYDLTISYIKDGKNATVSGFGGGTATVAVPYTPGKNEAVGGLYAVYVDGAGNSTRIADSAYDTNSGCLIFTTTHFSLYGIGYTAPSAKFTDISTHWAKESIDYVVGRGLLSGTMETTFAPDTAMTRGMLVTTLGRLANVDTKTYTTNSFTDVKTDSALRPYIEWAYKKGIVQGIGNSQFAPDRAVTREEIAVIFTNFAKATGYTLPVTRTATTYADASSIGSTYQTAVTAMQQAGIMMVRSENKFNPKASTTRAEFSSMLHRYIKLAIDPATAQGWAKNDAGQYFYYKDGKALTGWCDIGAGGNNKRYYFYTDGSLAVSTNIDGYEVDQNGVRKTK